jgi:hypothetical protein
VLRANDEGWHGGEKVLIYYRYFPRTLYREVAAIFFLRPLYTFVSVRRKAHT